MLPTETATEDSKVAAPRKRFADQFVNAQRTYDLVPAYDMLSMRFAPKSDGGIPRPCPMQSLMPTLQWKCGCVHPWWLTELSL